ncbi:MAG: molecular chaperone [Thermoanaerobaculia bacterium]
MELLRTLASLAEPPSPEHQGLAEILGLGPPPERAAFTELFELQLYPYASFYLGAEGMLGGEARDRIAGFWRALGEEPPTEPDHISTMLALQAQLAELERAASQSAARDGWRRARRAWLWEHLMSWLPLYCDKAAAIAPPYYERWAALVMAALTEEAGALGTQDSLSLHLRQAPAMIDPRREGGEAFLEALLAPVRSGLILVRSDLEGAARVLGLGCRAGERRFALRALLSQDAAAVLWWLASFAAEAASRYRLLDPGAEWVGFWSERATASAELLKELSRDGATPTPD